MNFLSIYHFSGVVESKQFQTNEIIVLLFVEGIK